MKILAHDSRFRKRARRVFVQCLAGAGCSLFQLLMQGKTVIGVLQDGCPRGGGAGWDKNFFSLIDGARGANTFVRALGVLGRDLFFGPGRHTLIFMSDVEWLETT